jgi:hypothetical protein
VQLEKAIEDIKLENEAVINDINKRNQDAINKQAQTIIKITSDYENLKHFETKKEEMERDLADTKEALELLKKQHVEKMNEMERIKIQDTEKLRKDMLFKIKETKATLLSLNDEQLNTTTRLTIL